MAVALGLVLLGIRVTTERRFNQHVNDLAAANTQLEHLNRANQPTPARRDP